MKEKEIVKYSLKILDKLDAVRAADAAKLAYHKASAQALIKFSSFLANLSINPKAFSKLSAAF